MKVLSELEQRIFNEALKVMPIVLERLKTYEPKARFYVKSFLCEGVVDQLFYDCEKKQFSNIVYFKGIGKGVRLFSEPSAYYDKVERCEIDLTDYETKNLPLRQNNRP